MLSSSKSREIKMTYIIGIAGGSGSGKTTFAKKVINQFEANVGILHMDSYYLPSPPENLKTPTGKHNFDHPKAFDWELLKEHLSLLKNGQQINVPKYDFKTSSRTDQFEILQSSRVIIFEGIFSLFSEEIRDLLDIKCFLNVDADIRFIRRLHRDVQDRGRSLESVINQYYDSVRPMYNKYLDPQKQFADFIVGEENDNASIILSSRIRDLINQFPNAGGTFSLENLYV